LGKRDKHVGIVDSLGFLKMIDNKEEKTTDVHMLADFPAGGPYHSVKRKL
jgi:hypothetical protein